TGTGSLTVGGGAGLGVLTFSNAEASTSVLTINSTTATNTSITIGSVTATNPAGVLNLNTGNASVDSITTGAKMLVNSTGGLINLTALNGTTLVNNTYNLLTFSGSGTYTGSFTLGNVSVPNGQVYTLNQGA